MIDYYLSIYFHEINYNEKRIKYLRQSQYKAPHNSRKNI